MKQREQNTTKEVKWSNDYQRRLAMSYVECAANLLSAAIYVCPDNTDEAMAAIALAKSKVFSAYDKLALANALASDGGEMFRDAAWANKSAQYFLDRVAFRNALEDEEGGAA